MTMSPEESRERWLGQFPDTSAFAAVPPAVPARLHEALDRIDLAIDAIKKELGDLHADVLTQAHMQRDPEVEDLLLGIADRLHRVFAD